MPRLSHLRPHHLVLPLAALLAVLPLLWRGASCGHDFDFHLLSWFEAARQFAHGDLHPRWASLPAYGAGEPRFVFYPPLSWTLGALLTLALTHIPHVAPATGFGYVPVLFTWMALTSAGIALYFLARRYVAPTPALLAATLYLSNPYLLFTAFERTAFAELLAATLLPLLLAAILPRTDDHELPSIPRIAVPLALLWLTNAPAAVMGSYLLALVVLLRLVALRRDRRASLAVGLHSTAGAALGLTLAAFYLVPAIYEQRWVEIALAIVPGMRIADNTLFHHTADPDHDAVLRTASLIASLLLGLTAVTLTTAMLRARRANTGAPSPVRRLTLVAVLMALLLTPISLPVWHHLPELAYLQFPWRLLAILATVCALSAALALRGLRLAPALAASAALLLAAAVAAPTSAHFFQGCDVGEAPQESFATLGSTYTVLPTDEYTAQPADNDALHPGSPPFRLDTNPDGATPADAHPGPAPLHLDLSPATPTTVILNLRSYPAWHATLNGVPVPHGPERDDGLLTLDLPAGRDHIDLIYAHTPDGTVGDLLSAVALLVLLGLLFGQRHPRPAAPSRPHP